MDDDDDMKNKFYKKDNGYKKVINSTRSPMPKLTLIKNESPEMRAPTPIAMVW
jgi:hypothetical protein